MISTVPQGPYVNTNKQAFERAKIPHLAFKYEYEHSYHP